MSQSQQILDRCKEKFTLAKQLYPHLADRFDKVGIRIDLKGRAAGMACMRNRNEFYIRFNADMLTREAFDHVLNETVPHEIAHIICFMDPRYGKNHDHGWARVFRSLGGSGKRGHTEEVVFGKGYTYEYVTDRNVKVRVGDKHHRYIQGGGILTWKQGKGKADRYCAYSIVGHQGRTLQKPIQKEGQPRLTTQQAIERAQNATLTVRDPFGLLGGDTVIRPIPKSASKPTIVQPAPKQLVAVSTQKVPGESKAATSRRIMLEGYRAGRSYEAIIAEMIAANGYDRGLARGTFKANAPKVGIPDTFGK